LNGKTQHLLDPSQNKGLTVVHKVSTIVNINIARTNDGNGGILVDFHCPAGLTQSRIAQLAASASEQILIDAHKDLNLIEICDEIEGTSNIPKSGRVKVGLAGHAIRHGVRIQVAQGGIAWNAALNSGVNRWSKEKEQGGARSKGRHDQSTRLVCAIDCCETMKVMLEEHE
jgi:hypothetical protein